MLKKSTIWVMVVFGVALCLAAPTSAVPPGASAVTCATDLVLSGSCDMELADLCAATESAQSPPLKQRDKDSLVGKVVTASMKLSLGKIADADQKLLDCEAKLDALANAVKSKIDEADADLLAGLLLDAQICVAAIP